MKNKESTNETIVKHFYNLPKTPDTATENLRQVTIIVPTMTIQLISSFDKETIEYLSSKALQLLSKLREKE